MTTRKQNTGIAAAVLGLAGGLFAWWKYKNSSDEEKARIKGKINDLGEKLKETYTDAEIKVKEAYDEVEHKITGNDTKKFKKDVEREVEKIAN